MTPVSSPGAIADIRRSFTEAGVRPLTNWVAFPAEAQQWTDAGQLFQTRAGESVFLIHRAERADYVFFFTPSIAQLMQDLPLLQDTGRTMVLEYVGRDAASPLPMTPAMTLQRMQLTGAEACTPTGHAQLSVPDAALTRQVETLLLQHFHPACERVPSVAQLTEAASNGGLHVMESNGRVYGILMYDKAPGNIHLRYWWVDAAMRGGGVGSSLLHRYFSAGQECRRKMLWVVTDNENAIKRYEHYGFSPESMYDHIYILNQKQ